MNGHGFPGAGQKCHSPQIRYREEEAGAHLPPYLESESLAGITLQMIRIYHQNPKNRTATQSHSTPGIYIKN